MYQFFGNNAMVRNISRVEAAPIYSTERIALSVQPLRDTTARPCGLGGRGRGGDVLRATEAGVAGVAEKAGKGHACTY